LNAFLRHHIQELHTFKNGPVFLAHPVYEEFVAGNFTVNKNQIPFSAVGVDRHIEHINKIMKMTGGIIGITQNAGARDRFF